MKARHFSGIVVALAAIALCAFAAGHSDVTVSFAGDILLDRGVADAIRAHSADYLFDGVGDIFSASDIAFANLEGPLSAGGSGVLKDEWLLFRADPSCAQAMKSAGLTILNLANNHSMDYGHTGLENTMEALRANGILPLGAGMDKESAHEPAFLRKMGAKIGFLGFSDFPPEGYFYNAQKADIAYADRNTLADAVKDAKENCDILIVSFHWGAEFTHNAGQSQQDLAHLAIESGADAVVGHHPHVLQGIEIYRGKPVFYSLGNFVFDQQVQHGTDETIIVSISVKDKRIETIKLIPVQIIDCQPVRADASKANQILDELEQYSGGLHIYREDSGTGYLNLNN